MRAHALHRATAMEIEHDRVLGIARQIAGGEQRRLVAELEHELRRRDAETRDLEGQLEAAHQRRLAEIEQTLAQSRTLRALVADALPQIAKALTHDIGNVSVTQIGGDAGTSPLNAVPQALAQVLGLARSFGLQIPKPD